MLNKLKMNVIFKLIIVLGLAGCTPNIVSVKSPMNNLGGQKCFLFPSKESLEVSPIYKQRLYLQTHNALKINDIKVVYGEVSECRNYLLTDWIVNSTGSTLVLPGSSQTNTYGNIYNNSYSSNSTTTSLPSMAINIVAHHGAYSLETGVLKNNYSLLTVWKGSQSGKTSRTSTEDAQRVADDFQPIVNKMIRTMLIENGLIND